MHTISKDIVNKGFDNMNLQEHKRTPALFKQWQEASEGSLKERQAFYELVQHTYRGTRFCDDKLQSAHHDIHRHDFYHD